MHPFHADDRSLEQQRPIGVEFRSESVVSLPNHRALGLARISHRLTGKAHDRPAITSFRLLAVLTVLFKYASARQAARASY